VGRRRRGRGRGRGGRVGRFAEWAGDAHVVGLRAISYDVRRSGAMSDAVQF
jgi:hypothetical protein